MTDESSSNGREPANPDPFGGLSISMIDAPAAPADATPLQAPGGPTAFGSNGGTPAPSHQSPVPRK